MKLFSKKELLTQPKIIGMFFIIFGLGFLISNVVKKSFWEKTEGIVKKVIKAPDENQYHPIVEFETIFKELVEVEIKESSNRFYYKEGDEIPIIYNKENYKEAKINSIGWIYGFPSIFILVGIIVFLIPSDIWYVS